MDAILFLLASLSLLQSLSPTHTRFLCFSTTNVCFLPPFVLFCARRPMSPGFSDSPFRPLLVNKIWLGIPVSPQSRGERPPTQRAPRKKKPNKNNAMDNRRETHAHTHTKNIHTQRFVHTYTDYTKTLMYN